MPGITWIERRKTYNPAYITDSQEIPLQAGDKVVFVGLMNETTTGHAMGAEFRVNAGLTFGAQLPGTFKRQSHIREMGSWTGEMEARDGDKIMARYFSANNSDTLYMVIGVVRP